MSYLLAKKRARKEIADTMERFKRRGEQPAVAVNLWCEFCTTNKKRWELTLVSADDLDKLKDDWVRDALMGKTEHLMACQKCINHYGLTLLRNDHAGSWDGHNEIIKAIFTK